MQITTEQLNSLGYSCNSRNITMNGIFKTYFSKDRESYLTVNLNSGYLVTNKFVDDRPKEMFRGHIESEEQLNEIINQIK